MSKAKLITSIVLIAAALVLVLLNTHDVTLRLPFARLTMSLALFGMIVLALGFLAGALVGVGVAGRKHGSRSRVNRR